MSIKYVLLIFLNAFLLVLGQIFWKFGMGSIQGISYKMFFNINIILGFLVSFSSMILWLNILPKVEFSIAYPLNSASYIFSLLAGALIFNEGITWGKVFGSVTIIMGILVMYKFG